MTIAEIAFGIRKILPEPRAARLEQGLSDWRHRFADRIFGLTEEAALAYGDIMAGAARQGHGMSAPDGMIATIARSMAVAWRHAIWRISGPPGLSSSLPGLLAEYRPPPSESAFDVSLRRSAA